MDAAPVTLHNVNGSDVAHAGAAGNGDARLKQLLGQVYRPIRQPMQQVEDLLTRQLQSPYESMNPLLCHGTQLGGKRLRPAMLLLSGLNFGPLTDAHLRMAVVIEMIHTATLIHDDVLDEATVRRRVPTVNARWNDHVSILFGDYLFSQSFRLAAEIGSIEACQWIGEASRLVCEGELRQVLGRDWLQIDEDAYFDMIQGKTAELCRVATQLGARLSGADDDAVDAMARYGEAVGMAFQIADDYLDLWGDDATVGKTLGTDLQQGKLTLPVIRMLQQAEPVDRERLQAALSGPPENRFDAIRDDLMSCDAAEYTRQVASRFRDQAIEAVHSVQASSVSDSLVQIARFAVQRRF
ncbi:polyprenyl synthetase family protein [Crateriforma conspicua]|uniref:Octaprenyl-diphosphate synthase n=1 Tax=Crateriforma conspicua TaxID=2527996 RepID=A0A5C5Y1D8_9PLAN|nr:polyprenyl synthetase family protein [Crateriforma conspicua]QDV64025.1 Octaprenyl-diphosphate synthase [Crateriforma conspicua]TWT69407.1 Octaprenyl-diphosphate synthase [Crateriforma conspicua]